MLHALLAVFVTIEILDVLLNVDEPQSVVVSQEPRLASTSPPASTVIDRKFVENLPLSDHPLQALLRLTLGVFMAYTPTIREQFTVNGQRPTPNSITADGVSAGCGKGLSGQPLVHQQAWTIEA
jgi:hypothetical protein